MSFSYQETSLLPSSPSISHKRGIWLSIDSCITYHIPQAGLLVLLISSATTLQLPGCSGLHTSLLTTALPLHNWQGFSPPFVTHSVHKHQPCMEAMESLSQRLWLFFLSPTWEIAVWLFHIYNNPAFRLWHVLVRWVHYAFTENVSAGSDKSFFRPLCRNIEPDHTLM